MVGGKLKYIKIATSQFPLELDFVLAGKEKQLMIDKAVLYNKALPIDSSGVEMVSGKVRIKTINFDSIGVKINYFPLLMLDGKSFDKNCYYQVMIQPAERLFELDKLSYTYRRNIFINRSEKIRYKKVLVK